MNRKLSLLTVAAFASAAISVAAQAPQTPPSSSPQTPPSASQASAADEATFVGCVAAADTAAATPATGGSKYVLKDAKKKEGSTASSSTPGASRPGSTGTAGTTGASRTYQLDAPDATITPEVGKLVEVVATLADSPSSASPSASPSSASATPKLKVKTIKMIAAKCSE